MQEAALLLGGFVMVMTLIRNTGESASNTSDTRDISQTWLEKDQFAVEYVLEDATSLRTGHPIRLILCSVVFGRDCPA
jgi:hypothetical protein